MARGKHRRKGRASPKWTQAERVAWVEFLKGESWFPPSRRPLAAVVNRLRGFEGAKKSRSASIIPTFEELPENVRHAASVEALAMLQGVSYRGENQFREMSEAICRIACGDVAFIVNASAPKPEPKRAEPDLFGTPEPVAVRHVVFNLPDDVLHPIIIATRKVIRSTPAKQKRRA